MPNNAKNTPARFCFPASGRKANRRFCPPGLFSLAAVRSAPPSQICSCGRDSAARVSSIAILWRLSNPPRQTLFEEGDAREALPKAVAAERRLRLINSDSRIEAVVADTVPEDAEELLGGLVLIIVGHE